MCPCEPDRHICLTHLRDIVTYALRMEYGRPDVMSPADAAYKIGSEMSAAGLTVSPTWLTDLITEVDPHAALTNWQIADHIHARLGQAVPA